MQKTVIYRYLGTNGIIDSPVHLEDVYYIRLYDLVADNKKILVNGDTKVKSITIPEEDLENWKEIPEGQE